MAQSIDGLRNYDDFSFDMNMMAKNGLKGQQAYSPGQRPGYGNDPVMGAPQGQKQIKPVRGQAKMKISIFNNIN